MEPTIQTVLGPPYRPAVDSDHQLTIEYDLYALYDWNQIPFVDTPAEWFLPPGSERKIIENVHRMRMDTQISP